MDPNNITTTLMHQQPQNTGTYKHSVRKETLNHLAN